MSQTAVLSRYELLERLAVGGMAELYKARRLGPHGFHKPVVIKRILPHLAADRTFVSMFVQEAQLCAHLDHPKIVQILELDTSGGELFIAMELVEGIDVLQLMQRARKAKQLIPQEIAVHIAHEVLDALDYAHNALGDDGQCLRIVHRDISPGNVLLSQRGNVKLTDFGIAQVAARQEETATGTLKGKYSYMAPEQVTGAPADPRSDLFSVSVVLSEMLMGRRLFAAKSDLDVLVQVRDARIDRLNRFGAHIDPELRILIDVGLERRPQDRYETAAEYRDALADWLYTGGERVRPRDVARLIRELPPLSPEIDDEDSVVTPRPATAVPLQSMVSDPSGDFSKTSPLRALWHIVTGKKSGRFVAERDEVIKEIYFDAGHPAFVRSNQPEERFGEYLVAAGAITRAQLVEALEQMHRFGSRLGATLVGLDMLRPLDAVRHLGAQGRAKILEMCSWDRGLYRWYRGEQNPWPPVALGIDCYEVIGNGVLLIEHARLEAWAAEMGDVAWVARPPPIPYERFGLEGRLEYVAGLLDGAQTMADLAGRFSAHDRLTFIQLVFLLHECELLGRA